jgi:hypothetical protein
MKRRVIYIATVGGLVCLGTAFAIQVSGQQNNRNNAKEDVRYRNAPQAFNQYPLNSSNVSNYQSSPNAYGSNQFGQPPRISTNPNAPGPGPALENPSFSPMPMMVPGTPAPGYIPNGLTPQYPQNYPTPSNGMNSLPGLPPYVSVPNYSREQITKIEFDNEDIKKSFEASQKIREAIAKFRNSNASESEKKVARAAIESQLNEQFKLDQKRRRNQLEQLEQQVSKLRKQLEKRDESQAKIIELRMQLLDNDADGLSFPESFNDMNIYNGGPAVYSFGPSLPNPPLGPQLPPGSFRNGSSPNGSSPNGPQDRYLLPNYAPAAPHVYNQPYEPNSRPELATVPGVELTLPGVETEGLPNLDETRPEEKVLNKIEKVEETLDPNANEPKPLD